MIQESKKIITYFFLGLLLFFLVGCKSSKDMRGEWYSVTESGRQVMVTVDDKLITFSSNAEKDWSVPYKEVDSGFVENVGFKRLDIDGQLYSFLFPNKTNKKQAVLLAPHDQKIMTKGNVKLILSKEGYPDMTLYKEIKQKSMP